MRQLPANYTFTIPALAQLAHGLDVPDFSPTDTQRLLLRQALCLLDFEFRQLETAHPGTVDQLTRWLADEL